MVPPQDHPRFVHNHIQIRVPSSPDNYGVPRRFDRQRRKRRANRDLSLLVRLTIRQTLASRTFDSKVCTFPVLNAERGAV